jgi:hypothetical protein
MYKVLGAENCSGGDTQWPAGAASVGASQAAHSQPISQSIIHQSSTNPPSKNLASSFSESFISSGKQGGGATVHGEGRDIVTRETCTPTYFFL